jgi:hypothetical protein
MEALYAVGSGGEDVDDDELAAQIRFQLPLLLNEAFSADGASVPTSFQEAMESPQAEKWLAAAADEYQSLVDRKVFKVVPRPKGGKVIKCMWVFSLKTHADGTLERYKARLVAKGFMQTYGVDYNETWAPTGRAATLRVLFALAAQYGWEIWGFDVSSAFLNAELHEEVYMEQPIGFHDGSHNVYQLMRPIYGLKQSPNQWWITFSKGLKSINLLPYKTDPATYKGTVEGTQEEVHLHTHVDDGNCFGLPGTPQKAVQAILKVFPGRDLGSVNYTLGIEVERDATSNIIAINQQKLIRDTLTRFNLADGYPVKTPMVSGWSLPPKDPFLLPEDASRYRSMVGTALYISVMTRPDISYAAGQLSRHMSSPTHALKAAAERLLLFLKHTSNMRLVYKIGIPPPIQMKPISGPLLVVYSDSDWGTCPCTRRSVSGIVITINGSPVVWASRKQPLVAKSTMAAEYLAASMAMDEALCVLHLLEENGLASHPIPLVTDNLATSKVLVKPTQPSKLKYIDLHFHSVRERIVDKTFAVFWVNTHQQLADMLTKALPAPAFERGQEALSLL